MTSAAELIAMIACPVRTLSALADGIAVASAEAEVCAINDDSRTIAPGEAFLCLPRAADPDHFLRMAMERGAAAAIVVGNHPVDIPLPLVQLHTMDEAGRLLQEGVKIDTLDATMVGFGFPVGPITLLDEVGLDVAAKSSHVLSEAFGERLAPIRRRPDPRNEQPDRTARRKLAEHALRDVVHDEDPERRRARHRLRRGRSHGASARAGARSCRLTPRSAHGKPPSGARPRRDSSTTHTPAVSRGDAIPRCASALTRAPTIAIASAITATRGTIATTPK